MSAVPATPSTRDPPPSLGAQRPSASLLVWRTPYDAPGSAMSERSDDGPPQLSPANSIGKDIDGSTLTLVLEDPSPVVTPGASSRASPQPDRPAEHYDAARSRLAQCTLAVRALPPSKEWRHSQTDSAIEAVIADIIDELTHGIVFETHRAAKHGSVFLDDVPQSAQDLYASVKEPGKDVFGQALATTRAAATDSICECPMCHRTIGASRFAPHLEKCMGMGRTSSLRARRAIASSVAGRASTQAPSAAAGVSSREVDRGSDDEDVEWTEERSVRKKRRKVATGSRVRGRPAPTTSGAPVDDLLDILDASGHPVIDTDIFGNL